MGRGIGCLIAALGVLALGRGAAVAAPETAALRYQAPPGCPDRAGYVARVAVHGGDVQLAADDAATARIFVVRIDERDGRFVGAVTILADRGETRRAVEAPACGELVDALALVTVLAGVSAPVAARGGARWRIAIGLGAAGAIGVTPSALPSVPLFAEVELGGLGRLRLGARWGRRSADVDGARATFDRAALQLDGCPRIAAIARGSLGAGACAGVQLGALRARGADIAAPQTTWRPWIAPIAGGRLRWAPGRRWFAELDVAAGVPLVRDRFFFAPDTTIHQVPRVVGELAIAIAVAIP